MPRAWYSGGVLLVGTGRLYTSPSMRSVGARGWSVKAIHTVVPSLGKKGAKLLGDELFELTRDYNATVVTAHMEIEDLVGYLCT
jgi:hypothetical protein